MQPGAAPAGPSACRHVGRAPGSLQEGRGACRAAARTAGTGALPPGTKENAVPRRGPRGRPRRGSGVARKPPGEPTSRERLTQRLKHLSDRSPADTARRTTRSRRCPSPHPRSCADASSGAAWAAAGRRRAAGGLCNDKSVRSCQHTAEPSGGAEGAVIRRSARRRRRRRLQHQAASVAKLDPLAFIVPSEWGGRGR